MTEARIVGNHVVVRYPVTRHGKLDRAELVVGVGDPVRLDTVRGIFRIHAVRTDGAVDAWGGLAGRYGMRTFAIERLRPCRRGDVAPPMPRRLASPLKAAE